MLIRRALIVLLIASATSGCDKVTGMFSGAVDQKTSDAQAIGYACRVSLKKPEDCMKENETQSTTAVLTGWKNADKDINERSLDPSMGTDPSMAVIIKPASAPVEVTEEKPSKKGSKKGEEATEEADQPAEPEKKPKKSH